MLNAQKCDCIFLREAISNSCDGQLTLIVSFFVVRERQFHFSFTGGWVGGRPKPFFSSQPSPGPKYLIPLSALELEKYDRQVQNVYAENK